MGAKETAEIEKRRVEEWRAFLVSLTGDVEKLIAVLKAEHPEVWRQYTEAIAQDDITAPDVSHEMIKAAHKLFPERKLNDLTNLRFRMNDLVADQFGLRRNDGR